MAVTPLLVLLYDRAFLYPTLRQALRCRWRLYLGLACCGSIIAGLWAFNRPAGAGDTAGFGYGAVSAWRYLASQVEVVLHYGQLAMWPEPLCLDYDWGVVRGFQRLLPPAAAAVLLLAGLEWARRRFPSLAFAGVWCLLILAPTSSIMPIQDLAAEHRMYLPMAAIVTAGVVAAYGVGRRLACAVLKSPCLEVRGCGASLNGPCPEVLAAAFVHSTGRSTRPRARLLRAAPAAALLAVLVVLGGATVRRNRDYHSAERMWRAVLAVHPHNPRAHCNLGNVLLESGRIDEAADHFRLAVGVRPALAIAHNGLATALYRLGRPQPALGHCIEALRLDPRFAEASTNAGNALLALGRVGAAIRLYDRAVAMDPHYAAAHNDLGIALAMAGEIDSALDHFREACRLAPQSSSGWHNLEHALLEKARRSAPQCPFPFYGHPEPPR